LLILSWETPAGTPEATTVRLKRGTASSLSAAITINTDVPWGLVADPENDDPSVHYQLEYLNRLGNVVVTVPPDDIRRFTPAPTLCAISFLGYRPDGSRDAGRRISVTDEANGGEAVQRVLTNSRGEATLYLMPGLSLRITQENQALALDAIIPDLRQITYHDLSVKYGSLVVAERRGWF
jgi:hypothetical protein